jgi:hypothetical protein
MLAESDQEAEHQFTNMNWLLATCYLTYWFIVLKVKLIAYKNISLSKEWTDFLENEPNREWVSG